jgi:hypothetical protein
MCQNVIIVIYLTSSCVIWTFFGMSASLKLECNESFKGPRVPKKRKLHKNELNTTFFCSTSPPKGSKWLKIFKISLTFRFDKLSNSSKPVHTGEKSQILTVSNKNSSLFKEFVCNLGFFWHEWASLKLE